MKVQHLIPQFAVNGINQVEKLLRNRFRIQMQKQMWAVIAVILLDGLLIALVTRWFVIPDPLLAILTVFGLVLILPGYLLLNLLSDNIHLPFLSKLAVSFVISVGIWSIPAAILLYLHSSLTLMVWIIVFITVILSILNIVHCLWYSETKGHSVPPSGHEFNLLCNSLVSYLPTIFVILMVAFITFAWISYAGIFQPSDRWEYAGIVRRYLDKDQFLTTGFYISDSTPISPRMWFNVWAVQLASVIKISQTDLIDMYSFYIPPVLMGISIIIFFTLALELFHNSWLAVVACALQLIYLLSNIVRSGNGVLDYPQAIYAAETGVGTGFWLRIIEDKFMLVFIVLPVAQLFFLRYLSSGNRRLGGILAITVAATVLLHPMGIVMYGISFFAYTLAILVIFPSKETISRSFKIIVVMLFFSIAPVYLTMQLNSIPAYQQYADYLAPQILPLRDNLYVADPGLLNHLMIILSLLFAIIGIMLFRKDRNFLFLFSNMVLPLIIIYNPAIAPLLGKIITSHMIWRIYLLLPVVLIIVYFLWKYLKMFNERLGRSFTINQYELLIAQAVAILAIVISQRANITTGIEILQKVSSHSVTQDQVASMRFLREQGLPGGVIMANDPWIMNNIPSMVGHSYGVLFRDYRDYPLPSSALNDVEQFYNSNFISDFHVEALKKYGVNYILVQPDSILDVYFYSLPLSFKKVYSNNEFSIYAVPVGFEQNSLFTQIRNGDRLFMEGHFDEAQREYSEVLALDSANIWAYLMLGDTYRAQGNYQQAQFMYENVVRIKPDPSTYVKLGDVYQELSKLDLAEIQYQNAQTLKPDYFPAWEKWYQVAGDLAQKSGHLELAVQNFRKVIDLRNCIDLPQQPLDQRYLPVGWPVLHKLPLSNNSDSISDCLSKTLPTDMHFFTWYDFVNNSNLATKSSFDTAIIRDSIFFLGNDPRRVLFQHPNSWMAYKLYILPGAILDFSLTLSPEIWQVDKGDGVQFDISIENSSNSQNILSTYIDPKNIASDRRWHDYEIDLSPWAGNMVTITFTTSCGPNNDCRYDWAGWGEPRIVQPIAYDFLAELPNADHGGSDKGQVKQDVSTIEYQPRSILFQHPSSRVTYRITVPEQAMLNFGLGMDPSVWLPDKGDGVEYNIFIRKPEEPYKLYRMFHRYIDPKNNPEDRHWFDETVDLSEYGGQTVEVVFEALPGPSGDNSFDWGGWSNPVLVAAHP